MTTPRRRWSFSLRTLFVVVTVVAIPLGWIGYQLNWIRQRAIFLDGPHRGPWRSYEAHGKLLPWHLALFAEMSYSQIELNTAATDRDFEMTKRLFPEAEIVIYDITSGLRQVKKRYDPEEPERNRP